MAEGAVACFALVAGELSGDRLGAGLIESLRQRWPQAEFLGIGGPLMQAQGLRSLYPLEALSVMGVAEVIQHLPGLIRLRADLCRQLVQARPAAVIGIDAPDFNLGLERRLRQRGIFAVHYVSPQVWAWRRWRAKKIGRSVDLMLTLFPFEAEFYRKLNVPVRYVGHPLADQLPLAPENPAAARRALALDTDISVPTLALLPGSRRTEVAQLAPLFIETAYWLRQRQPELTVMMAAATETIADDLRRYLAASGTALPVHVISGRTRTVLTAADAVLLASGTATLETLLLKKPMVVAYKMKPLSAWLARRLVKISYFALPNLLANKRLVPEFFQRQATVERLGAALLELVQNRQQRDQLSKAFTAIHRELKRGASERAAAAIAEYVNSRR